MKSIIDIKSNTERTAEQKIEAIQPALDNLVFLLSAQSKMKLDQDLSHDEYAALVNTAHHLVVQIHNAINA